MPESLSESAIRAELEVLLPRVALYLGLNPSDSRWVQGGRKVEMLPPGNDTDAAILRPDGTLALREDLTAHPARLQTLIHELNHSFSAGGTQNEYGAAMGWEEGLVEHLQRLMLPDIAAEIGVPIDPLVYVKRATQWPYREYLPSWENLREALGATDAQGFYSGLLRVKIKDRHAALYQRALTTGNIKAVRVIAQEKATLNRNLRSVSR